MIIAAALLLVAVTILLAAVRLLGETDTEVGSLRTRLATDRVARDTRSEHGPRSAGPDH